MAPLFAFFKQNAVFSFKAGGCCEIDARQKLTATAVPVFCASDEVIASLGCYSPVATTDFIRQKRIFQLLQEFARRFGAVQPSD